MFFEGTPNKNPSTLLMGTIFHLHVHKEKENGEVYQTERRNEPIGGIID